MLRDLHRIHGSVATDVDLDALWARLGVVVGPGGRAVRFDDDAPEADLRRAVTGQARR